MYVFPVDGGMSERRRRPPSISSSSVSALFSQHHHHVHYGGNSHKPFRKGKHRFVLQPHSCFAIPFQGDFRQSYRGSISVTAQCIETQLIPNDSLRKDLQSMVRPLCIKLLLRGVICVTKSQCAILNSPYSFFLLLLSPGHVLVNF